MTKPLLCPITWARKIGEAKGLRSVIVFQELPDGSWVCTSWGKKMADCSRAAAIGKELMSAVEYARAIEDGKI